jgi:hypothetical protein
MQKRRRKAAMTRGVTKHRSKRLVQDNKIDLDVASERGEVNIVYDSG